MQQLFYENYEQNKKGYIRDLHNSKIHRTSLCTRTKLRLPVQAAQLHAQPQTAELRHRTIQLHREIVLMSKYSNTEIHKEDLQLGIPPSFMRFQPRQRERFWNGNFWLKYFLAQPLTASPRRGMTA